MKKFILLTFLSTVFLSCNSDKEEITTEAIPLDQVKLLGHIQNYSLKDSIYKISIYVSDIVDGQQEYTADIDPQGNFTTTFPIKQQQDITIFYKTPIKSIVKAAEEIELFFDGFAANSKELYTSAHAKGKSENINNNLYKYISGNPIDNDVYFDNYKVLQPLAFKKYHDSAYEGKQNYIHRFLKENKVSDNLKIWIEVEKQIEPLQQLLGYTMFNPLAKKHTDQITNKTYLSQLNEIS